MSECLSLKYYPVQVAGPVISSKQMILMNLPWRCAGCGPPVWGRQLDSIWLRDQVTMMTVDKYNELKYTNTISACLKPEHVLQNPDIKMWDKDVITEQIISISGDGDDIFCFSGRLVSSSYTILCTLLSIVSDRYTDRVKSREKMIQAVWLFIKYIVIINIDIIMIMMISHTRGNVRPPQWIFLFKVFSIKCYW